MSIADFPPPVGFSPIVETLAQGVTAGKSWDVELVALLEVECPSDCEDECCVEPAAESLDEEAAEDMFDDFLNEFNPTVSVMGYDYDPARVLKEVDPIAYRQEFLNWVDSNESDGNYTFPWNQ